MRRMVMGLALSVISFQAVAQGLPGGGPPGGGPPPGGMSGGKPPMRMMKPITREKLDKVVTAMFRTGDTNGDGLVTLDEFRAIIAVRREKLIRSRFEKIDGNKDGTVSFAEFLNWQRQMGSVADSEYQPVAAGAAIVAETIPPELGDDPGSLSLAVLIEPLSATTIINANTNYDAGVSLEELLTFERKRFDSADFDGDGQLTMEELRSLNKRDGGWMPNTPIGSGGGRMPCPPGKEQCK